jgi:hypothetical protein
MADAELFLIAEAAAFLIAEGEPFAAADFADGLRAGAAFSREGGGPAGLAA